MGLHKACLLILRVIDFGRSLDDQIMRAAVNRARVLCLLGKAEDALSELGNCDESTDPQVWRIAAMCQFMIDEQSENVLALLQKGIIYTRVYTRTIHAQYTCTFTQNTRAHIQDESTDP